ncbi:hypothetical protein Hanom_Chr10g00905191 [Helianthus anomalus]
MFIVNQSKFCTLKVLHGDEFSDYPKMKYLNGKIIYINTEELHFDVMDQIMKDIRYSVDNVLYYFIKNPHVCLDFELRQLSVDVDLEHLCDQVSKGYKLIDLYVEIGHSTVMMHSLDDVEPFWNHVPIEATPSY